MPETDAGALPGVTAKFLSVCVTLTFIPAPEVAGVKVTEFTPRSGIATTKLLVSLLLFARLLSPVIAPASSAFTRILYEPAVVSVGIGTGVVAASVVLPASEAIVRGAVGRRGAPPPGRAGPLPG